MHTTLFRPTHAAIWRRTSYQSSYLFTLLCRHHTTLPFHAGPSPVRFEKQQCSANKNTVLTSRSGDSRHQRQLRSSSQGPARASRKGTGRRRPARRCNQQRQPPTGRQAGAQGARRYRAAAWRMSGLNRHISRTRPSRICCSVGSAIASSGELKGWQGMAGGRGKGGGDRGQWACTAGRRSRDRQWV